MRVANKTLYDSVRLQLGNLTESLEKSNEVVSTTKRINRLSDDPIGLTQVISLKSSLESIAQYNKNIDVGKSWLTGTETALSSANDLILTTRQLALNMANASVSASQRQDAVEQIDATLTQLLDLANTRVSGSYIFAGTRTDVKPFEFDDESNPTEVIYNGNQVPFSIKTSEDSRVAVGANGAAIFWEDSMVVDETNNKIDFIEYPMGAYPSREITATIESGTYSPDQLATAVENAMNSASEASGFNIDYVVNYNASTGKFSINDDGTNPGAFEFELLWGSGSHASCSIAPDMGFDAADVKDTPPTSANPVSFPVTIDAGNNVIDFREDTGNGLVTVSAQIAEGTYNTGAELAAAVESAMNSASAADGHGIEYEISYDGINQKFVFEENDGTCLQQLQLLWQTNPGGNSAAGALGFVQDCIYTPVTSDHNASWGIFDSLFDLKEALSANDVDGISRAITRLDTHFGHVESGIADIGHKYNNLELRVETMNELELSYTQRRSSIEDADIIEAIMDLEAKQLAYQAALGASSKIMQMSLVDYL